MAKAAELGGREAAQALWGLAALRRVPDAALAGALTKASSSYVTPLTVSVLFRRWPKLLHLLDAIAPSCGYRP